MPQYYTRGTGEAAARGSRRWKPVALSVLVTRNKSWKRRGQTVARHEEWSASDAVSARSQKSIFVLQMGQGNVAGIRPILNPRHDPCRNSPESEHPMSFVGLADQPLCLRSRSYTSEERPAGWMRAAVWMTDSGDPSWRVAREK